MYTYKYLFSILAVAFGILGSAVSASAQANASVAISQVYGAGGNSMATWRNDYVEIYNRSTSSVSLTNWAVQYATSGGTTWTSVPLTGSLQSGQYFLIQLGSFSATGTVLPQADATGTVNIAQTSGKIALTNATNALSGDYTNGIGTSIIDCCKCFGAESSVLPIKIDSLHRASPAPVDLDGPCGRCGCRARHRPRHAHALAVALDFDFA